MDTLFGQKRWSKLSGDHSVVSSGDEEGGGSGSFSREREPLLKASSSNEDLEQNKTKAAKPAQIGFWSFVFLSYFCSSGGPFGLELAVGSGYPMLTLLLIVTIPWTWSMPLSLMTAELSTTLPSNDGVIVWTKTAFGPFVSFVIGTLSWMNAIINNAMYPSLFISYIDTLLRHRSWVHGAPFYYTCTLTFIFVIMIFNMLGVDFIARLSTVFAVAIILPFIIMLIWSGVDHLIIPHDWIATPKHFTMTSFSACFNILIWNYSGYDFAGSLAEELKDPKRNFPRAMFWAVLLTIFSYLLAVLGSIGIVRDWGVWDEGYFGVLAQKLGGKYLGLAMILGGSIACIGSYNAILCTCSQQLRALAAKDLLDSPFLAWKHPRFDMPWTAIFVNTLLTIAFSFLPFAGLVAIQNILYSVILIAEYSSLIKLRITHKHLERPYQVSEKLWPTILMSICPFLICGYIMVSAAISDLMQFLISIAIIAFAIVVYGVMVFVKRRAAQNEQEDKEEENEQTINN